MNKQLGPSRIGKRLAVALGVALAASTVAVPSSGAAKISAAAKNDLTIMINEPDAGWCNQDSPGIDQVAAKNSVLETLTIQNDKGKIVPYLAEAYSSSADFKQWTVTLRKGIKFHDGEELTSKTVQMNMLANLGLMPAFMGGKGPKGSLPAIAWLDLAGINTAVNPRARTIPVDGAAAIAGKWANFLKIVDTYTVQFNLATPRPNFPYLLWSVGRQTIMSSNSLLSPSCGTTVAAGTGPFMVKSKGTDPNTTVLVANPNYWRKAKDGSALPKASTVTFKYVADAAQRANAVRTGQADIATFGATSGTQINELKKLKGKVTVFDGPKEVSWVFHLNTTQLPFAKKSARLAFAHAIDTKAFTQLMTKGNGVAATSIAPTMHPFYVKGASPTFNLAKAKEYAAQYKTETGQDLKVVLPVNQTTESTKANQAICNMLGAAGIPCSLMPPVTSTQLILRGFALQQQASWFNVNSGYYADFGLLFVTNTNLELSGFGFTDPTLTKCFEDARAVSTKEAFAPCATKLSQEAYQVPTYFEGGHLAWNNKVKGIGSTPLPGGAFRPIISGSGFDIASATKG
jgi:ABC-type transport system substrate-binding protein